MNVYTDGSCTNNGSLHAKAGYGVYFGETDSRNEYARVIGKQTNNTGELTGFIRGIELSLPEIEKKTVANIYTDSEYVIKCMNGYCKKLVENDWKTSTNKTPPNLDLLQKAYELYTTHKKYINVFHIKAHTDNDDEHSHGNKEADRLANLAVDVDVITKVQDKYYINIDYDSKDKAKTLGAKWDMNAKKWYYTNDTDEDNKRELKLLEESIKNKPEKQCDTNTDIKKIDQTKIYVKIPFNNKNSAKKFGARWDASVKSWYYTEDLSADKISQIKDLM